MNESHWHSLPDSLGRVTGGTRSLVLPSVGKLPRASKTCTLMLTVRAECCKLTLSFVQEVRWTNTFILSGDRGNDSWFIYFFAGFVSGQTKRDVMKPFKRLIKWYLKPLTVHKHLKEEQEEERIWNVRSAVRVYMIHKFMRGVGSGRQKTNGVSETQRIRSCSAHSGQVKEMVQKNVPNYHKVSISSIFLLNIWSGRVKADFITVLFAPCRCYFFIYF